MCGKVIEGHTSTIHLGIISHVRSEARKGKRNPEKGRYGSEYDLAQLEKARNRWRAWRAERAEEMKL